MKNKDSKEKISYNLKGLIPGDFGASCLSAVGLTIYGAIVLLIASAVMVDFDWNMFLLLVKQIFARILPIFYLSAIVAVMIFHLVRHYYFIKNPDKMFELYKKEYDNGDLFHFRLGKSFCPPINPYRFGKNGIKFFNL